MPEFRGRNPKFSDGDTLNMHWNKPNELIYYSSWCTMVLWNYQTMWYGISTTDKDFLLPPLLSSTNNSQCFSEIWRFTLTTRVVDLIFKQIEILHLACFFFTKIGKVTILAILIHFILVFLFWFKQGTVRIQAFDALVWRSDFTVNYWAESVLKITNAFWFEGAIVLNFSYIWKVTEELFLCSS